MDDREDAVERIGGVILDLSHYTGDDQYSEGAAEDELLEAVRTHGKEEYNHLIADCRKWSMLYHLSDLRGNIVDFLPIEKTDSVLEVGAGCGAVTGTLAELAGEVTCIDLSKKRSLINAERNKDRDNVRILVGNFQDIEGSLQEKYDYIMLIGVLEYAGSYIEAPDPYETFLRILAGHLKEGGIIAAAIENKYGLKYFAGCREDHTGKYYDGIEGYPGNEGVRTFSKKGLTELAKRAALMPEFYYPYPDYKLPVTVFSDERLPAVGELTDNIRNFDTDRFIAFQESAAFDELIREGSFPEFSNSYLMLLRKDDHKKGGIRTRKKVYSRHSVERADKFRIRTDLEIAEDGERVIVKVPVTREAAEHLESMSRSGERLSTLFSGSKFLVNRVKRINDGEGRLRRLEFEFLSGPTLSDELHICRIENRTDDALMVIRSYCDTLRNLRDLSPFERTDRFDRIFGEIEVPENTLSMPVTNVDLTFDNLIISGGWNMIDYEWTFDFPVPLDFVIYRAIFYFVKELPEQSFDGLDLFSAVGISEEDRKLYRKMEHRFQCYIKGERFTIPELYSIMGRDSFTLGEAAKKAALLFRPHHARLYFDRGNGFSEWDTCAVDADRFEDGRFSFRMMLPEDLKALRIDPVESRCMLKLLRLAIDGKTVPSEVNGEVCGSSTVLFDTGDPQILIRDTGIIPGKELEVEYKLQMTDPEIFSDIAGKLKEAEAEAASRGLFRRGKPEPEYKRIYPE